MSLFQMVKIFLAMEHGDHVGMPGAEFVQCSAYRLEPITKGSFNDLDGEVIESGPIQATVIPRAIQSFCNPK
jgi:sphingosine kinase